MKEDIIFAGFGGQGIMLMGKALAYAAMSNGKFVTWMPSYGAEVRGGTAHSMVIISDSPIASPVVKQPSICVAMNKPSFQKFREKVKSKGLLVINKSLIASACKRKDVDVLEIPATDMAIELGNSRVSNMITLGALLAKRNIFPVEDLIDRLEDIIPVSRKNMIPINKEAIRKGYEYGSR
ncbi:MAG: 2-oxoacid:acceptor oxidoreductase family protein [Candidatus Omnitrophota bacterium]|jgi:2-oxoglutarate ferredoxin oxidoreductase subunit gamma|nr:2-oxoacid:acceptor oxidoreductase family protein [Candidatus Omnitrophota bacterium]